MTKRRRVLGILGIIIVLVAGGVTWFLSSQKQTDRPKLIVGTDAGFKPFEYIDEGKVVGFDIDLMQEIANDMKRELVVEQMSFDGLLAALQAKRIDVVAAGMTVTEDRAKSVNFSDAYYEASQMIIVRRNDTTINSKNDLVSKTIGVQLGTTGDSMVDGIEGAKKVQFTVVAAVLQELSSQRIDAVILDNAPAENYLRTRPDLKMLSEKLSSENYALAVRKDDPQLLMNANQTIARIKSDGTYDALLEKYFSNNTGYSTDHMSMKEIFIDGKRYMFLVNGVGVTLLVSAISVGLGIVLGIIVVLMRLSRFYPFKLFSKKRDGKLAAFNPLVALAKLYTTVIRGTPVLVQLLIFYYVIFSEPGFPKIIVAAAAFGLNSAAYIAEILRSGFEALPKGQWEAAESLGFSYLQTIRYITMPQVLKNSLPSLVNEFIALVKETSIVGWIGLSDLMRGADNIRFQTATAFESLAAAAIIYLCLTTLLTRLSGRLERKLRVSN